MAADGLDVLHGHHQSSLEPLSGGYPDGVSLAVAPAVVGEQLGQRVIASAAAYQVGSSHRRYVVVRCGCGDISVVCEAMQRRSGSPCLSCSRSQREASRRQVIEIGWRNGYIEVVDCQLRGAGKRREMLYLGRCRCGASSWRSRASTLRVQSCRECMGSLRSEDA